MSASRQRGCAFSTLPVEPQCFVGRAAELRELLQSALSTQAPLVNLVGPSKIGRTSFLHRLQNIAQSSGKSTPFRSLFESQQRLIAPLVDLGMRRTDTTVRRTIAHQIAAEMTDSGLEDVPPAEDLDGDAGIELLIDSMTRAGRSALFLLLVDRAEHILPSEAERAEDEWARDAVDTLGVLNDAVPSFGLVLSFGTSGPVSRLDASAREQLEQDFLLTVSTLLNRVLGRVELGLLDRAEVTELASNAVVHVPGAGNQRLTADEIEWIADVAGGHPFVLHRAGMLAWMLKTDHPATRRSRGAVEEELVKNLRQLMRLTLRRLSTSAGAVEAAATLVASGDTVALPDGVAHALIGEGLVEVQRRGRDGVACRIPSPAIHAALQAELVLRHERDAPSTWTPTPAAPGALTISIEDSSGSLRSASISVAEHRLLETLLAAPESVTTRAELLAALGDDANEQQLVQRLSVLRKKIHAELGIDTVIKNVYGRGYVVVDPHRFRLSGP